MNHKWQIFVIEPLQAHSREDLKAPRIMKSTPIKFVNALMKMLKDSRI